MTMAEKGLQLKNKKLYRGYNLSILRNASLLSKNVSYEWNLQRTKFIFLWHDGLMSIDQFIGQVLMFTLIRSLMVCHSPSPAFTIHSNIKGISMADINSLRPHLNMNAQVIFLTQ